jgi:hypothetical protein
MTIRVVTTISALPNNPAVYGLYGGNATEREVAYVGIADKLRQRVRQHLLRRDSSVVTGTAVVSLNPDLVTAVRWWEHVGFAERIRLEAAELVAFEVLEPTLRSRGVSQAQARQLYADADFYEEMHTLFSGEPAGQLAIPTLQDALEHIAKLERRVALLEGRLGEPR